jgi:diguanylate cyclase (GGDEF)-like protein
VNPLPHAGLERARELSYLDPEASRRMASELIAHGAVDVVHRAWAQALLALYEARVAEAPKAEEHLQQARHGFAALGDARGLGLCDEVQAILLRRGDQVLRSHQWHREIDARPDPGRDAFDDFLAHNSRAITAKVMNDGDSALSHFYSALAAARQSGWEGPQITALGNLGGYHRDLYNLEDARDLGQQAFAAARRACARQTVTTAGLNLISVHHQVGDHDAATAMADFLLSHLDEQMPNALDRGVMPLALARLGAGRIDEAEAFLAKGPRTLIGDGDGKVQWGWIQGRCHLARGQAEQARALSEPLLEALTERIESALSADAMELARVASEACEALGDHAGALKHLKQAQGLYELLVGRSARARYRALQTQAELAQAQREREAAEAQKRALENDRERLAALNQSLQTKIQEVEALHAQMRDQALHDTLTGLHNRRYLFEVVPGLIELARRQDQPLSVALLDLDHFKNLNDTRGHAAGDEVLKRFAQLLKDSLRRSDVIGRYGGEEFVVVMPGVDVLDAEDTLDRVLTEFRALEITVRGKPIPPCSFSAGVAEFPRFGDQLEPLLLHADRALYAAKRSGRARVTRAATEFGTFT